MQRLESVAAVAHALGQRQQADTRFCGLRRQERQLCNGQPIPELQRCCRVSSTADISCRNGLESTQRRPWRFSRQEPGLP